MFLQGAALLTFAFLYVNAQILTQGCGCGCGVTTMPMCANVPLTMTATVPLTATIPITANVPVAIPSGCRTEVRTSQIVEAPACGCRRTAEVPACGCAAAFETPCGCRTIEPMYTAAAVEMPSYGCGCRAPVVETCGRGYRAAVEAPSCGCAPTYPSPAIYPSAAIAAPSCGCGCPNTAVEVQTYTSAIEMPACGCAAEIPTCGCSLLPPAPPVIGCGKYLRQVTVQPPFL